jgi:hypothetical protein
VKTRLFFNQSYQKNFRLCFSSNGNIAGALLFQKNFFSFSTYLQRKFIIQNKKILCANIKETSCKTKAA